jgi:hypothetical protein
MTDDDRWQLWVAVVGDRLQSAAMSRRPQRAACERRMPMGFKKWADTETRRHCAAESTGNRAFPGALLVCFRAGLSNVRPVDHVMDITKRNHYNPCFWTALWNLTYYEKSIAGATSNELARKQVVHALSAKSQKIYAATVERVHFDKNLGIAEISKPAAEDFVRRYHPDQYEQFVSETSTASYPIYLDFENILSGIEATPAYQTLLKVATTQTVDNLIEKCYLASFVVLQNLRSHSMMNAMIDWQKEIGHQKFEHLVILKWMLSDPHFLFRLVHPLISSQWNLYTSSEHCLPLCDSPILVQPASVMVALSPRLLLDIRTDTPAPEGVMPISRKIDSSTLEEHRLRTVGNTFREIIGEPKQLETWRASTEFQARSGLMKDIKRYNTMIRATSNEELWHLNAYGNRR